MEVVITKDYLKDGVTRHSFLLDDIGTFDKVHITSLGKNQLGLTLLNEGQPRRKRTFFSLEVLHNKGWYYEKRYYWLMNHTGNKVDVYFIPRNVVNKHKKHEIKVIDFNEDMTYNENISPLVDDGCIYYLYRNSYITYTKLHKKYMKLRRSEEYTINCKKHVIDR